MNYPVPPQIAPQHSPGNPVRPPLGEASGDCDPVSGSVTVIEAILRQPRRILYQLQQPGPGGLILRMLFLTTICSLVYGVIVGTFSGHDQLWIAPLKVAGGLLVSGLICLPSLYIFACLSGSQARLVEICGLICGLLLLTAILLIGFAPVAWLFSQSTDDYKWMGTLHLVFWGVATVFGLRFLESGYSHSHARSNPGLATWVVIFTLVVLQMTTALRPIIGTADTFFPPKKQFFVSYWYDCLMSGQPSSGSSR
jgi:hypothetical protein